MRARRAVAAVSAAIVAVGLGCTSASASGEQAPADEEPGVVIPEGSVLATPEEVLEMGGTAAEADMQRDIWRALPDDIAQAQTELSRSEHAQAQQAFDNIVPPSLIMPAISPQTCGGAGYAGYYKIASNKQATQCFAGAAGTYTLTTQFVDYGGTTGVKTQAAAHTGRVYYSLGNGKYWTTTRSAGDYTWRAIAIGYDQRFVALKVQLF